MKKKQNQFYVSGSGESITLTIKSKKFTCKKGHSYFDNFPTFVTASAKNENGGYVELKKINICPVCYVEWIERNVSPAEEVNE